MADFPRNFRDRCPPPRTLCPRSTGLEIYDVDRSNFFYSDWPSWFECDYSDHPLSKPTYSYFFWLSIWNQGSSAGDVQIYTLLREPLREHFAILTQSWFFGKLCRADHKIDRLMRHNFRNWKTVFFLDAWTPFLESPVLPLLTARHLTGIFCLLTAVSVTYSLIYVIVP